MRYHLLISVFAILMSGCTSSPRGSNWWVSDFNKYDMNYLPFPTDKLSIGMTKSEILSLLGDNREIVEAGENHQTLAYQQWVSVAGPDYVGKTLYLKIEDNILTHWSITNDTVSIVPRSW